MAARGRPDGDAGLTATKRQRATRLLSLPIPRLGRPLSVLCIGAHADDIEIGAGATLLSWIASGRELSVHWCVLSALGPRRDEAVRSADLLLDGCPKNKIEVADFEDGLFPAHYAEIKRWFGGLRDRVTPDVVLTHHSDDAHQDHRIVAEATRTTFRDHLTLAYEIPKWDGDLGRPNMYVPVSAEHLERKIQVLMTCFPTQANKDWFDAELFRGLARLRGMECRAPQRFAEAFHVSKFQLD